MKDNLAAYKMTIWSLVFPAILHSTMARLWSLVHSLTMTARGGAAPEAGVAAQGGGEADQLEGGEGGDVGEGGWGWRGGRRPGQGCGGRVKGRQVSWSVAAESSTSPTRCGAALLCNGGFMKHRTKNKPSNGPLMR